MFNARNKLCRHLEPVHAWADKYSKANKTLRVIDYGLIATFALSPAATANDVNE